LLEDTAMPVKPGRRNHMFDLLRLFFATVVLLAHAAEWVDGDMRHDLISWLLRSENNTQYNFGYLGVDGFFLLSGFLIVQSWVSDPEFFNYLRKRILRIVPGYMVAMLFTTFVVGILAPGTNAFFRKLGPHYVESLMMLGSPNTPPVFPGAHQNRLNQPAWTIPYEFRCYLLVAIWGVCGLFRRRAFWAAATALLLFLVLFPALTGPRDSWHTLYYFTGQPPQIARLCAAFFIGGSFNLFRERIAFRPWMAAIAAAGVIGVGAFAPLHFEPAILLFGGYLLFYFGQSPAVRIHWLERFPDISYGVYLYGGPVEGLWIWYTRSTSPWTAFLASVLICYVLGWLSWHLVERPMLKLKRHATAALPSP
jgi:peptidoglycan/LPS O-acetylase OafA/YrhL